jgi:cytochrome P450
MLNQDRLDSVKTPANGGGLMAFLLKNRAINRVLSRTMAWLFSNKKGAVRLPFTRIALVIRHCDVMDVLMRDTDFLIAPTNAKRFEAVDNPFILAMDRGPVLSAEHRAMYTAFARVDRAELMRLAATDIDDFVSSNEQFDVIADYIWPICARNSQRLFGLTHVDPVLLQEGVRSLFAHIFFNGGNDQQVTQRAQAAAAMIGDWIKDEIARRRRTQDFGTDFMGQMMRNPGNDDDRIKRCLLATLVGSIDTITASTAKILRVIAERPDLRRRMRDSVDDYVQLGQYAMEALRFWPHNPFLARYAPAATSIGQTRIKPGSKLIVMTAAAMFDPSAFPEPGTIRTDRPVSSYLHFGHGIHECTGRMMSIQLIPLLLAPLIKNDFEVTGKIRWAGPFPNSLHMKLSRREP